MNYQFLAMIVGFLTIVFTILNLGHQLNQKIDKLEVEINRVEDRLSAEIEKVEDRLLSENKATNAKSDTFLLALC